MAAAGRTAESATDAGAVAAALGEAPLCGVVAHADGASLAAAGLLAHAVADDGRAYQVSVARTGREATRRVEAAEHPVVAVGADASAADAAVTPSATLAVTAFDAARELGATPEPVLALAGLVAGGGTPGADDEGRVLDAAAEHGVERRPGVAVPTADLADGLAHTTLAHAEYSGDAGAAQATLAELDLPVELDGDARRRVASMLALDAVGAEDAPARAGEAIEQAVRPLAVPDGTFETVEGYADVLTACAREQPGLGAALALGHGDRATALDVWRAHAAAAHEAVRRAETSRFSGLLVADVGDRPPWTAARLLRAYRSPEPAVLALGDGEAALAGPASHDQRAKLDGVADDCEAIVAVGGTPACGYAELDDGGDADALVAALREVA